MKFKESKIAHQYLDGLKGVEIGASAHNPFGLDTINVDYNDDIENEHKQQQMKLCGEVAKVDVVAQGDNLPFADKSFDFVISSHVIEHFYDPMKALLEWERVAKKYIFIIVPHKERTFDKDRELTTVGDLQARHTELDKTVHEDKHWSVWTLENFTDLLECMEFNIIYSNSVDDKVGNGFMVVIKTK